MSHNKNNDQDELEAYYRDLQKKSRRGRTFSQQDAEDKFERALEKYIRRHGNADGFLDGVI